MRIRTSALTVRYGAVAALSEVSLDIGSGERRAVIGPNGAGKTTLFKAIAGEIRPSSGRAILDDRDVTRLPSWRRARLGLSRTFQRSTLFPDLTVAENLGLSVRARLGSAWHFWPGWAGNGGRREVEERLELAGLGSVARSRAGSIAHGEQRALEIELALAAEPRALLLDEPMAGLSGAERQQALARLQRLPAQVTLVIVEHDLDAVFTIADRISVLDHGLLIADGTAAEVRNNPRVQEVYLGV